MNVKTKIAAFLTCILMCLIVTPAVATDGAVMHGATTCGTSQVGVVHWSIFGNRVTVRVSDKPTFDVLYLGGNQQHDDAMVGTPGITFYTWRVSVDDNNYLENAWITCRTL